MGLVQTNILILSGPNCLASLDICRKILSSIKPAIDHYNLLIKNNTWLCK